MKRSTANEGKHKKKKGPMSTGHIINKPKVSNPVQKSTQGRGLKKQGDGEILQG